MAREGGGEWRGASRKLATLVDTDLIGRSTNVQQNTEVSVKTGISKLCKTSAGCVPALSLLPPYSSFLTQLHASQCCRNACKYTVKDRRGVFKEHGFISRTLSFIMVDYYRFKTVTMQPQTATSCEIGRNTKQLQKKKCRSPRLFPTCMNTSGADYLLKLAACVNELISKH